MNLCALSEAVAKGDRHEAERLTRNLLDSQMPAQQIVEDGLTSGMHIVGERFARGEAFVPELLIASRAMKQSMTILEPLLAKAGVQPRFTALLGTVAGDLHDIGKNLVGMMWRGANVQVIDLGVNVPPERFVAAAREHRPAVVGLSALLTTTLGAMKDSVAALKQSGLGDMKVVVGGAPVTRSFAVEIDADGFAPDAASAVNLVLELVGTSSER
jgi:5-methyltetrahydrofolate--homocysteine methyltransferase